MARYRQWLSSGPLVGLSRSGGAARELLLGATKAPTIMLFPRSDGPGSSHDLLPFAAMGHRFPVSKPNFSDLAWAWSRNCLRTPGACLDGEPIVFRAYPAEDPEATEYYAPDFHAKPLAVRGDVPGRAELFVNNILHQFGMKGVRIEADSMPAVYRGTGLGGSNLAHLAAMIFASSLSGAGLDLGQIFVGATFLENFFGAKEESSGHVSFGVSVTGGQESLTALQGGFYDNVHTPFYRGPFSVVSRELLPATDYAEVQRHMLLVNVGVSRKGGVNSSLINNRWMAQWRTPEGTALHMRKTAIAYRASEALRLKDWHDYAAAIKEYREVRVQLCSEYISGQLELQQHCEELEAEYFPLGAGTGTCLVVSPHADSISEISRRIHATPDAETARSVIPFKVREEGAEFIHFEDAGLEVPKRPQFITV